VPQLVTRRVRQAGPATSAVEDLILPVSGQRLSSTAALLGHNGAPAARSAEFVVVRFAIVGLTAGLFGTLELPPLPAVVASDADVDRRGQHASVRGEAMPIDRYGVLEGQVVDCRVETSDTPHYQIRLRTADGDYRAAVNVRSAQSPPDLLFLVDDDFRHPVTDGLTQLPSGFTALPSHAGGLALDYIRGNLFDRRQLRPVPTTQPGPNNDLGEFLDHYVEQARDAEQARAYVFGQRWGPEQTTPDKVFGFRPGNGVHDVHMNQGNDGRFVGDDGVWQDGGLLLHLPDPDRWVAVFLAFQSQAWHTDDMTGHAITQPTEQDRPLRIIAALVNPFGPAPEPEAVTLLNASPDPVDLQGWTLVDRFAHRQPLAGAIPAGMAIRIAITAPVQLGNHGGTISLLDQQGMKADGVAYTADQASREGWTVVFA
jgi:uncharacterized protein YukJ